MTYDSSRLSGGSNRRTFLKLSGSAGVAGLSGVAGCLGGAGGGTPTINILTWEEYAELTDELEKRVDAKVEVTKSTSSSKMFTAWNSGKDEQYDIAVPNNNYVPKFATAGLADPVPKDQITHYGSIYDTFKGFAKTQFTQGGKLYGVPLRFGWYGYSYDSRTVPEHEQSYKILFEPKYTGKDLSGKLIMYNNHFKAMSAAALYLGYGKEFEGSKVTLSEKQLQKVTQTMIDQKKHLQGYIAADPTYIKSFKQGNFEVGQSGRNEIVSMWTNGNDWPKMATPKEGSLAWFEAAVVSKKSKHKDVAWDIVNELISPELGAKLAQVGYSPSVNPKTQQHLTNEQNEMYGSIKPERLQDMIPFKAVENERAWITAWEEIKSA
jgi:spermidine/putrescine transport system substrate-binding protein